MNLGKVNSNDYYSDLILQTKLENNSKLFSESLRTLLR